MFLNPDDDQWVIGRFAYSDSVNIGELALRGEDVDIYLARDCGTRWEKLGVATTASDDSDPTIENVPGNRGRIFFKIPADKRLGPGRHRIHMIVAGDLSATDVILEIVAPGTPMFVSDVDGTLTTSEMGEATSVFTGTEPGANPSAPDALRDLAAKGFHPMYLTARSEIFVDKTRRFLADHDFPPGIVRTSLSGGIGERGVDAAHFKATELLALGAKGLKPLYAFGNMPTDAEAYAAAAIFPVTNRIFYKMTDTVYGGRRIDDYAELLPGFTALSFVCR